jgi:RNA-directed DNA polymerase
MLAGETPPLASSEEPEKIHGRHTWENPTNPGAAIAAGLNRLLPGCFEYFKHSHKWTFPRLDEGIRRRLRSILRRRSKRQGISRGFDHIRRPNKFFRDVGLFILEDAHRALFQSP